MIFHTLISFISGILFSMGFPMKHIPNMFFLPIVSIILLIKIIGYPKIKISNKKIISFLICFLLGANLVGYYWIPDFLTTFGNIKTPYNYLVWSLFSILILPQITFFILIWLFLRKFKWIKKVPIEFKNCLCALILVLLEYYSPQLFPTHIGHPWLQFKSLLGLAPIFGVPIFSFSSYWIAFTVANFFNTKKIYYIPIVFFIIIIICNILMPLPKINKDNYKKINTRIVQANTESLKKDATENSDYKAISEIMEIYYNLSVTKTKIKPKIIIWPETAYNGTLNLDQLKNKNYPLPEILSKVIKTTNAYLFTGSHEQDKYNKVYNSAFLFDPTEKVLGVHRKNILILFGEKLPLHNYFVKFLPHSSFFDEGKTHTIFKLEDITFISLICYEILFSEFIRAYLKNNSVNFIINLSNDYWYGNTSEPKQHLFLSHWRALEFNIPIIRSTNTGISTILYPDGSTERKLGFNKQGVLDIELPIIKNNKTPYQSWGILGTILIIIIMMIITLISRRTKAFSNKRMRS